MKRPASYYQKMFPNTRIEGFEEVVSNLNKELERVKAGSLRGLVLAAAHIRRATETAPPLTPVDLGNLRASWFTVSPKGKMTAEDAAGIPTGTFKGYQKSRLAEGHKATIAEGKAILGAKYPNKQAVMIGYTAHYALYVHEGPGGNQGADFQRPGAGIKWFEAAVKRNVGTILKIVRDNAQIP